MAVSDAITVSAPGSLMLLGEHAVLHGYRALVCAINRRIQVCLKPLAVAEVRIISSLGSYHAPLDQLSDHPSFRFVLEAVRSHSADLPGGFELEIKSGFSADIGFGSSAAVTVAVHGALMEWMGGAFPDRKRLFSHALRTVRTVQGRGSGADLAASVFGGVVSYTMDGPIVPVPQAMPLTAVYCGYKVPTAEVIRRVDELREKNPARYEQIFSAIDRDVAAAVICLQKRDRIAFGEILNRNHVLMNEMGVNTAELQEIVNALQADPDITGAKISGSGMGDCAVGVGHAELKGLEYSTYHLEVTPTGFCREEG